MHSSSFFILNRNKIESKWRNFLFFFRPPFGSACQLFGRGWNWNEIDYIFSLALDTLLYARICGVCIYVFCSALYNISFTGAILTSVVFWAGYFSIALFIASVTFCSFFDTFSSTDTSCPRQTSSVPACCCLFRCAFLRIPFPHLFLGSLEWQPERIWKENLFVFLFFLFRL